MNTTRTTNLLLFIIAVPIVIYLLKILSFIFVPLLSSMFIALLFAPLMRKMKRRGIPKWINVGTSIAILVLVGAIIFSLLNLSSQEILSTKDDFLAKAETKITEGAAIVQQYFGIETGGEEGTANLKNQLAMRYAQPAFSLLASALPQLLMTLFFVVLWLSESINFERLLNDTILKHRHSSVKTFYRIEKEIVKFLLAKILISAGTGIGTGIACYAFDVSFPIFWGFFAFAINFIQMIGSIITVVLGSIFAFVEMEASGSLLLFILSITSVQVIFGSILEPVYMGKSFSINIIMVLVMLLFWGYVWGVPGMIMSIPITVFMKIIFEQFEKTRVLSKIMS